jgi:hypothetical protein
MLNRFRSVFGGTCGGSASTRAALRPSNFSVDADVAGFAGVAAWANDLSALSADERVVLSLPEGQFQGPILICRYPMAVSVFVADAVSLARSSVEEIYSSHGSWLYDFLRNLRKLPAFPCFFR